MARRKLLTRPQADDELSDAAVWYERQRPGLGGAFISAVDRRIDRIRDAPDGYEHLGGGVRRAPVDRFPYTIVFRASATEIVVLAIPHNHRNDATWRRRAGLN